MFRRMLLMGMMALSLQGCQEEASTNINRTITLDRSEVVSLLAQYARDQYQAHGIITVKLPVIAAPRDGSGLHSREDASWFHSRLSIANMEQFQIGWRSNSVDYQVSVGEAAIRIVKEELFSRAKSAGFLNTDTIQVIWYGEYQKFVVLKIP